MVRMTTVLRGCCQLMQLQVLAHNNGLRLYNTTSQFVLSVKSKDNTQLCYCCKNVILFQCIPLFLTKQFTVQVHSYKGMQRWQCSQQVLYTSVNNIIQLNKEAMEASKNVFIHLISTQQCSQLEACQRCCCTPCNRRECEGRMERAENLSSKPDGRQARESSGTTTCSCSSPPLLPTSATLALSEQVSSKSCRSQLRHSSRLLITPSHSLARSSSATDLHTVGRTEVKTTRKYQFRRKEKINWISTSGWS